MNNPLHGDAGKELIFEDTPSIIDADGAVRKLGALVPNLTLASSLPLFEDASGVPLLTDDQIKDYIVNGGKPRTGRTVFGDDWICNQAQFGSCNGWASACALERARMRRGLKRVKLSGSSVYSRVNGGRDNGSIPEDAMVAMQKYGAVPLERGPANKIYANQYTAADWAEGARYRADECFTTQSRQALLTAVVLGFDAVVAVHAGNNYMRLDSEGVAYGDNGPGNHAILYDDLVLTQSGLLAFDHAGSWGLNGYGVRGRAFHTWERHLVQPVRNFRFYLIRSTKDDPQEPNPPQDAV
jgi:predicted nucleic acid-binding protein